jgi:hypothetical protein
MPKDPERAKPARAVKTAPSRAEEEDEDDVADEDEDDGDEDEEDEDEEDDEDDEDDEAEDEEDEGEDEEADRAKRAAETRARSAARETPRRPAPPTPLIPDEREIDSPRIQTLGMLGVIAGLTIVMALAGKAACNYHPPTETRKPRDVSTAELAKDPKNAAIELQQRWATYDFKGALELAKGAATQQLQQDQQSCVKDAAVCKRKAQELANTVLTTASLLRRESSSAIVRVTSIGAATGKQVFLMDLVQDGSLWKATARRPDAPVPPQPATEQLPSPPVQLRPPTGH